jgi:hypothetical protein
MAQRRPARLSTLAGTPTSRSAAALIPLRVAHEAANFTNASSSSASRWAWSIWASCVDVQTLLNQFDLTDRRRFLGDPLLDLGTPLLKVGLAVCRPFGARRAVR